MTTLLIHREVWKVHGLAWSIVAALHVGVLLWLSMGGMEPTLQAPKRKPLHLQFIHTSQAQSLSKTKQEKLNATLEKVAVPQSQSSTKTNDLIRDYAVVQTAASTSLQNHPLFVTPSINAALNFKYQPYVFDGHAVMVQNVRYTFQYQISKSS